jgi:alkaline phosphatase
MAWSRCTTASAVSVRDGMGKAPLSCARLSDQHRTLPSVCAKPVDMPVLAAVVGTALFLRARYKRRMAWSRCTTASAVSVRDGMGKAPLWHARLFDQHRTLPSVCAKPVDMPVLVAIVGTALFLRTRYKRRMAWSRCMTASAVSARDGMGKAPLRHARLFDQHRTWLLFAQSRSTGWFWRRS